MNMLPCPSAEEVSLETTKWCLPVSPLRLNKARRLRTAASSPKTRKRGDCGYCHRVVPLLPEKEACFRESNVSFRKSIDKRIYICRRMPARTSIRPTAPYLLPCLQKNMSIAPQKTRTWR